MLQCCSCFRGAPHPMASRKTHAPHNNPPLLRFLPYFSLSARLFLRSQLFGGQKMGHLARSRRDFAGSTYPPTIWTGHRTQFYSRARSDMSCAWWVTVTGYALRVAMNAICNQWNRSIACLFTVVKPREDICVDGPRYMCRPCLIQ